MAGRCSSRSPISTRSRSAISSRSRRGSSTIPADAVPGLSLLRGAEAASTLTPTPPSISRHAQRAVGLHSDGPELHRQPQRCVQRSRVGLPGSDRSRKQIQATILRQLEGRTRACPKECQSDEFRPALTIIRSIRERAIVTPWSNGRASPGRTITTRRNRRGLGRHPPIRGWLWQSAGPSRRAPSDPPT